jgi:hypothetical protein
MTGALRGMLALALALIVPAQGAAACCLLPRGGHAPAHAPAAPPGHASAVRHGHSAGDGGGAAASDGWAADPDAPRAPCFVPASSPALRQRPGDAACSPGPVPGPTIVRPGGPFTTSVVTAIPPLRESPPGSFRPLRL